MFAYIAKPKEVKRPALAEIVPEFNQIQASITSSSSSEQEDFVAESESSEAEEEVRVPTPQIVEIVEEEPEIIPEVVVEKERSPSPKTVRIQKIKEFVK